MNMKTNVGRKKLPAEDKRVRAVSWHKQKHIDAMGGVEAAKKRFEDIAEAVYNNKEIVYGSV